MSHPFDSVLLIGFGSPSAPEDVPAFLEGIVGKRPGARERIEEVRRHYEQVGGSPYNRLTKMQADALATALERRGIHVPVRLGFRHWHPFIQTTLEEMAAEGLRRTLVVLLAAHQCRLNNAQYLWALERARRTLGGRAPTVTLLEPWYDDESYVKVNVEAIQKATADLSPQTWAEAALVFSVHAIPAPMCHRCRTGDECCPYASQVQDTAAAVARSLGHKSYSVAYQSSPARSSGWTSPDLNKQIEALGKSGVPAVVVAPIGFLCDHVEVLFDLDVEARAAATDNGLPFYRSKTPGTHPSFIGMLADNISNRMSPSAP